MCLGGRFPYLAPSDQQRLGSLKQPCEHLLDLRASETQGKNPSIGPPALAANSGPITRLSAYCVRSGGAAALWSHPDGQSVLSSPRRPTGTHSRPRDISTSSR